MKIGFICPEIRNDFHNDMAIALAKQGHRVVVYTEENTAPSAYTFQQLHENGVEYWIINNQKKNLLTQLPDKLLKRVISRNFLQRIFNLVRFLRSNRDCDIAIVEREWPCIAMAVATLFIPMRWIGTAHGHHDLERKQRYRGEIINPKKAKLLRWAMHRAFHVRANSYVVRDLLVDLGLPQGKITVIPMHITKLKDTPVSADLVAARIQARTYLESAHGIPKDAELIVIAARLDPHKGIETVLNALPEVIMQRPKARLMICGGAHPVVTYAGKEGYLESLREMVQRLGIGQYVVFTGHVDRTAIWSYNIAADVHAAPSVIDTFNYSPVEAALLGTFGLTSDMTGCGPWLEQVGAGKIVSNTTKGAWAAAIIGVLSHPSPIYSRLKAAQALRDMLGVDTLSRAWSDLLNERIANS